jgi:competence protein ComEA
VSESLTRTQLVVYSAVGVALLLLGVKALRASEGDAEQRSGIELATEPVGAGGPGAGDGDLVVHVAGAVEDPGVYRLPAGSRVAQALERAGGPRGGAQPDAINLAARLADGQQVVVPTARAPGAGGGTAASPGDGPISLGSAELADLEQIEGIGPVTAQKILDYRDERGGIAAVEELDAVPGIGPATLETLSDRLQP